MFRKLIIAAVGAAMSFFAVEANAQQAYNMIATAYVTTCLREE